MKRKRLPLNPKTVKAKADRLGIPLTKVAEAMGTTVAKLKRTISRYPKK